MLRIFFGVVACLLLFPSANWAAYTNRAERIEAVQKLEQKFDANKKYYLSSKYHEDDVRRDFIDPLFETLGWDILNNKQVLLYQQDSVPEARLSIFGYPKRIDYSQRIDDRFVFFIEAKAADKDLSDKDYIFQAKRYCWSSGTTDLVILTGYAGMRVYDCRIKPDYNKPEQGELKQFRMSYDQYDEKYDLLWDAFAKPNVQQGSIKKLLKSVDTKAERIPMESALVSDLEKMRLSIAQDILKNNPDLSEKQISAASQTILNKILFTRILEDRDIITTKRLYYAVATFYKDKSLFMGDKGHYFRNSEKMHTPNETLFLELQAEFKDFAKMFNGAIFSDTSADGLKVSNDVLKDVVLGLYQTYDFSVVPLHVIGKAYESYLGKTIAIQKGGLFTKDKLVMRERPEVKSAGGVFYTPAWVAEYMTDETLGKLLTGKTPTEFEKFKLLDPACGSGVFPATAAQLMFDRAADYYAKHPSKIGGTAEFPDAIKLSTGETVLGPKKRADIIKNSIFCVDTDAQAIENTKMLLYIMILENSGISTAQKERKSKFQTKAPFAGEHESFALPDLDDNIICANSLVGTDFGNATQNAAAKAFDWNSGKIGKIVNNGGFDVVIGNPPYIRTQKLKMELPAQYEYMRTKYTTMQSGQSDIMFAFFEKGKDLLKKSGYLSFIVSNSILTNESAKTLRTTLTPYLATIIDFGKNNVFPGVGVQSIIITLNGKSPDFKFVKFDSVQDIEKTFELYKNNDKDKSFSIVNRKKSQLKDNWAFNKEVVNYKIATKQLGDIAHIFAGQSTGLKEAHVLLGAETVKNGIKVKLNNESLIIEKACVKMLARGRDIKRYVPVKTNDYIIYPYDNDYKLLSEKDFKKKCPNAYKYISQYQKELKAKKYTTNENWFKLYANRNAKLFARPKIFTNWIKKDEQAFSMDIDGGILTTSGLNYGLISTDKNISNEALLGILNSKYAHNYFLNTSRDFGTQQVNSIKDLKKFPIVPYSEQNGHIYQKLDDLVRQILKDKETGKDTKSAEIEIDNLVNELYKVSIAKKPANDNINTKKAA